MNIKMIGIDHEKAILAEREIFAFTKLQSDHAMKLVVEKYGASGCVILSTCNRTEVWIRESDGNPINLVKMFCELKSVPENKYQEYEALFVIRKSKEAFYHLYKTACGMKSQIWGEDQILTQIKTAIEQAREADTADTDLEKLFQMAITCAKKIKTQTKLTAFDVSIGKRSVEKIREIYPELEDKNCLVIGNGEMSKIISEELVSFGARVFITLRKYKSGICIIPKGCSSLDYDNRYEAAKEADIIVSATSNPHFTIKNAEIEDMLREAKKTRIFVDLAVPRDIDPRIKEIEGVILFDMDSMGFVTVNNENNSSVVTASEIIDEYIEEYEKLNKTKDFLPQIKNIAKVTTSRISHHMKKEIEELSIDEKEKKFLDERLCNIAEKAVSGLLFGMKDSIDKDLWDSCFSNLEKVVR